MVSIVANRTSVELNGVYGKYGLKTLKKNFKQTLFNK